MNQNNNNNNRPNTIDIQLINKNLSEKIQAIKQTGHVQPNNEPYVVRDEQAQGAEPQLVPGGAQQALQPNTNKQNALIKFCKDPVILLVLYMIIHNKIVNNLIFNKVKFLQNVNNEHLQSLILGAILVITYTIIKKFI
jgi:hypothetical protein